MPKFFFFFFSYRIHLSPGSRRSSTSASRSAMIKSYTGDRRTAIKRGSQAIMVSTPRPVLAQQHSSPPPSPPIAPPALEQAYSHDILPGPDSPPALVQATLPELIHHYSESVSSRSSSPPEYTLTPALPNEFAPVVEYPSGGAQQPQSDAQYGHGVTAFHEPSHGGIYGYENGSSLTQSDSMRNDVASDNIHSQTYYSNTYNDDHSHITPPPIQQFQHIHNSHTPPLTSPGQFSPISSRHSISHISHPGVYPNAPPSHPPTTGPSSPASIHSSSPHTSPASGSPTPAYSFHDNIHETHGYQTVEVTLESITDAAVLSAGYYNPQNEIVSSGYDSSATSRHSGSFSSGYDSPPPLVHSEVHAPSHTSLPAIMTSASSQSSPYLHHPRPMSSVHQYHLPLQPADWGKPQIGLTSVHN